MSSEDAYSTVFDANEYIDQVYSNLTGNGLAVKTGIDFAIKTFKNHKFSGSRILEFGGGPSIMNAAVASSQFSEIIFAEYSEPQRNAVLKWTRDEPGAFDWSEYLRYICQAEGNNEDWEERQKKLRNAIKEVIPCDANKPNPLEPRIYEPFDAIITSLAIEAACSRHVLLEYQIYALRVSLATPMSGTVMSVTSSVMRCRVQVKVKPHCVIFLRRLTDSYILCI
ncbi:indolethylamine N-methyltransferase-like [Glandiceps talaboti]